jgi:hypothetical protein
VFSDSHTVLGIRCATDTNPQELPIRDGTSVALRNADARYHAAFIDMDPLAGLEHVKTATWSIKNTGPEKASPFAQKKLIGKDCPTRPI